jgi:dGTPase
LAPHERADRRHGGGKKDDDRRGEFQRDRDRLLYSTALRRLAGITQVVSAAEGHVFDNRLTHRLEVAQRPVAAETLSVDRDLAERVGGVEPEVAEVAALAYDLAYPPFVGSSWASASIAASWHS